ncbi:MAG: hypothetical protein ACTSUB_03555 [Candidatus Thorarchaeota archaeon]
MYVSGEYYFAPGKEQSHAWLEQDGLIIDITADQFDDVDVSIFISDDHEWYRQFENLDRTTSQIDEYNMPSAGRLWCDYSKIEAQMNRLSNNS